VTHEASATSERLTGPSALRAHLTLAGGLALCVVAFWFELGRALGGNALSWAYVFEWPMLGAFGVYMWWRVLHPSVQPARRKSKDPGSAPEFAGMLAAWQEHQRELAARREPGAADLAPGEESRESR
jgi:hypothetical protein